MHDEVLRRSEVLERDGRLGEAADLLLDACRIVPDARLEERSVALRHDACRAEVDHEVADELVEAWEPPSREGADPVGTEGGASTDPEFEDPWSGHRGHVELSPDELTTATLASAMRYRGAAVVRGLVPSTWVDRLLDDTDHALSMYRAWLDGADVTDTSPWYSPFNRPAYPALDRGRRAAAKLVRNEAGDPAVVSLTDSPRAFTTFTNMLGEVGLRDTISEHLGERPAIWYRKAAIWNVAPGYPFGFWHQDGFGMVPTIRTVNVWVALTRCGRDAPGLDIAPGRFDVITDTDSADKRFPWCISQRRAAAAFDEQGFASADTEVEYDPGDVALFDERCIHRPAVRPGMTRTRRSIECWHFAPSTLPYRDTPVFY